MDIVIFVFSSILPLPPGSTCGTIVPRPYKSFGFRVASLTHDPRDHWLLLSWGRNGELENWKIGRLEDRREGQPTRSQCPCLRNLKGQNPGAEGVQPSMDRMQQVTRRRERRLPRKRLLLRRPPLRGIPLTIGSPAASAGSLAKQRRPYANVRRKHTLVS